MKSLLHYNTFGIDQSCKDIYEPATVNELKELLPVLRTNNILVIGGGSNLLLTKDFDGYALHPLIKGITVTINENDVLLRCGAGEVWDEVVDYAVKHGYNDMENLSWIPGEVGASAVQNIGAYGMEVQNIIYKIEAIEISTGEERVFTTEECDYAYRYSKFKGEWKGKYIITYVTYRLSKTFTPRLDYGNLRSTLESKNILEPTAADVRNAVIDIRQAKLPDPKVEGNAGSFFMNPIVDREKLAEIQKRYPDAPFYNIDTKKVKIPAGWMIDKCGWKGKTIGHAGVHAKQALVLVNKGGAKGEEIVTLCETIRKDVKEHFGIDIHPEVNII